jgi:hypothetical protein
MGRQIKTGRKIIIEKKYYNGENKNCGNIIIGINIIMVTNARMNSAKICLLSPDLNSLILNIYICEKY